MLTDSYCYFQMGWAIKLQLICYSSKFEHLYLRSEEWFVSICVAERWHIYLGRIVYFLPTRCHTKGILKNIYLTLAAFKPKFFGMWKRRKERFLPLRHLLIYPVWLNILKSMVILTFFFFLVLLGIKPRALSMLSKC